jgi:serine protease Do
MLHKNTLSTGIRWFSLSSNSLSARYFVYRLCVTALCLMLASIANAESIASNLFGDLKHLVFQIRVIDRASGEKSSLGSGFQISSDGHIATNFHVVSSFVHKPKKFRLEYAALDGSTGDLELKAIDVIHDLAVLTIDNPADGFFKLNEKDLVKGKRLYSMGNPLDLGMTIIEGTYNGLLVVSRYKKILFSGSLNAGMSGGPAMDSEGRVIGINVAKGGEQLSFLVPVKELVTLLDRATKDELTKDFEKQIEMSLLKDQSEFYSNLLDKEWKKSPFSELLLSKDISDSIKCWGHTKDDKDMLYEAVHQHCHSQDQIFISENFYTGNLFYDYEWTSTDKLNRFQFYSMLQNRFKHVGLSNAEDEEDITDYVCSSGFVEIDQHSWKISNCTRAYKKYRGLYDYMLLLASSDMNYKNAILKISAAGIDEENISRLTEKFISSIKWIR